MVAQPLDGFAEALRNMRIGYNEFVPQTLQQHMSVEWGWDARSSSFRNAGIDIFSRRLATIYLADLDKGRTRP